MDKKEIRKSRLILRLLKVSRIILWCIIGIVLTGLLFFFLVWMEAFGPLPGEGELKKIKNANATLVFSSDEQLIGKIFEENRSDVTFAEFPQNLLDALIATEDARFYEHDGVDRISLIRVLVKSIIMGNERSGGGSTITQQLAKNLYGRREFGFLTLPVNKVKEMILAERIENIYSKEQILELYLNTVSFSENVYGISEASRRFFGKPVRELHAEESAVLVALLKANTYYNPRLNPANAMQRRNLVLHLMESYGYISKHQRDSLQTLPIILTYKNLTIDTPAGYFLDMVKDQAASILQVYADTTGIQLDIERDGLRIHTTLNNKMQGYAQQAVYSHLFKLQELFDKHWEGRVPWEGNVEVFKSYLRRSRSYQHLVDRGFREDSLSYYLNIKKPVLVYHSGRDSSITMSIIDSVGYYLKMLNCAFMAMEPESGAVLSYMGGLDYRFLPFDNVHAKRQAASAFKPILYATALEQGQDPCEFISNDRRTYPEYDNWSPRNYHDDYEGMYSMKGALKKSINVVAVKTIFKVGVGNVVAKARQMGIEGELPASPSLALGTGSVSLYEMMRVYGTLANNGIRPDPYMINKITTSDGELVYEHKNLDENTKALDSAHAKLITEMLRAVVNEGTGYNLRSQFKLENDLAGKTGTAQNYTDGWFIGYNPGIVAGVWVGAPSPAVHFRTGTYGSGSAMALPVFGNFFKQLNQDAGMQQYTSQEFAPLNEELTAMIDCPDFREGDLLIHRFFDLFGDDDEGEPVKEKKKDKPGFFERLFKKDKD